MKPIRLSIAVAVLACAVSAPAQNSPVPTVSMSESQLGKAMTTKEKIQQLKPATNLVELMQLLKTIHEQVLLIDPYFMEDENIFRLFGQGRIEERKDPSGVLDSKRFFSSGNNPFQFLIRITGSPKPPGYGSLTIGDYKQALPFDHELIEKHLMPGVQGGDPLHPLKPMTNEARNIAGGRPLANRHKGYWKYAQRNKTEDLLVDIDVALDRSAQVLNIKLTQKEE